MPDDRTNDDRTNDDDTRRQLLDLLLGKIEADTYPSVTMLDMVERLLTPEEVAEYASVLMAKISADNYPSIDLIRRVMALS